MEKFLSRSLYVIKNEGFKIFIFKVIRKICGSKIQTVHDFESSNSKSSGKDFDLFSKYFETAKGINENTSVKFKEYKPIHSDLQFIAFYLPQFHPFKENNEWWGKGFTEWTNVSKAVPQFIGHYQPKLPSDLGFYDLRLTSEIMKEQATIAKNYGIKGFCFHHYWFDGHRLMETPVDNFLEDQSIDMKFCLCWANENWTRRWDGAEHDILMAQNHSSMDDLAFIADISKYMRDNRYIRVDGKPVLIVYRVTLLPEPKETAKRWRKYCLENGIGEIHLVVAQSFGITDPIQYGFDAAVEFPPHGLKNVSEKTSDHTFYNQDFEGKVFDYKDVVNSSNLYVKENYELYRTVFPAWDNEARKPGKGHVFHGSTPALYAQWLNNACKYSSLYTSNKLVFINAWNEWAEGAYLEPDRKNGYAYLDETRKILALHASKEIVSVLMPVYNHEKYVYDAIKSVANQSYSFIELIIVNDGSSDNSSIEINRAIKDFSSNIDIKYFETENQGSQKAIALAVENSSSNIISLINSDDIYHEKRIELCMLEYLTGRYSFIFTDVNFIDFNGINVEPKLENNYFSAINSIETIGLFNACKMFNLAFSTGNMFMSKNLYNELGGFGDYQLCHDWDFLLRALSKYEVLYLRYKAYNYRYHGSNTFTKLSNLADIETNKILGQFN